MLFGPEREKNRKNKELDGPNSEIIRPSIRDTDFIRPTGTGTTIFVACVRGRGTLSISNQRGNWFGCSVKREDKRAQFTKP